MLWKATLPRLTAQAASQLRAATRQWHTPLHYPLVVLRNAYVICELIPCHVFLHIV